MFLNLDFYCKVEFWMSQGYHQEEEEDKKKEQMHVTIAF